MTLRTYIWGLRIVNVVSFSALALVIYFIDPFKSGVLGVAVFYLILFFALSGVLNLFLLWLRKSTLGGEAAFSSLALSFRQGILLSLFVVGLLILQSFRLLLWWDGLLLLGGIFVIEFYFLSKS